MSAILSADDLNDFISPSVACIKPVEILNDNQKDNNVNGNGKIRKNKKIDIGYEIDQDMEIQIDGKGNALEINKKGESTKLEKAQISLSDCLACSGCITSSEEVLMEQHSYKELLKLINDNLKLDEFNENKKIFVLSISYQARSSISNAFNLNIEQTDKFLIYLFNKIFKFKKIIGLGLGKKLSFDKISNDIIESKFNSNNSNTNTNKNKSPILSSICPGWVLYCEKTHPQLVKNLNNVKSPQQITGLLLKKLTYLEYNSNPNYSNIKDYNNQIYHVSLMPCFDKKLEAAKLESDENNNNEIDVNCVITPKELIQLLKDENFNFEDLINEIKLDNNNIFDIYNQIAPKNWLNPIHSWLNYEGNASGGYSLQYLINLKKFYEKNYIHNDIELDLDFKKINGRNNDIYEIRLINKINNEIIGSSSVINGFKNIQNIVRKLKLLDSKSSSKSSSTATGVNNTLAARRKARMQNKLSGGVNLQNSSNSDENINVDPSKTDFIEVMACPSGCINGGGQISGPEGKIAKEWLNKVLEQYESIPMVNSYNEEDESITELNLNNWLTDFQKIFNISESRFYRVNFREPVEPPKDTTSIALGSKW
ncbi:iron-sulfur cluster binding protein [[Candida] boidinii]|nr:iron-sulfur cluster binding protein [[Candida] boidinii]OWB73436.1 iron-sulfur cluster binding protein [[Candida] boidinii]GME89050.1 unnamed protein product [[Candida] boidinii]